MKTILLSLLLLWVGTSAVVAQKSAVFTTDQGAIRGYDPVAYFTTGKPTPGKPQFTYTWQGAQWHFATQQNLEAFRANPDKFSPQYGGYCAYGTADGHKAPTDPQAWTVTNGKLYLNYDKQVQQSWNKDQKGYIEKADKNWPRIKDKE